MAVAALETKLPGTAQSSDASPSLIDHRRRVAEYLRCHVDTDEHRTAASTARLEQFVACDDDNGATARPPMAFFTVQTCRASGAQAAAAVVQATRWNFDVCTPSDRTLASLVHDVNNPLACRLFVLRNGTHPLDTYWIAARDPVTGRLAAPPVAQHAGRRVIPVDETTPILRMAQWFGDACFEFVQQ